MAISDTTHDYQPEGFCPRCGYWIDPGRCPECGLQVTRQRLLATMPRFSWRSLRTKRVLVWAVSLFVLVAFLREMYHVVTPSRTVMRTVPATTWSPARQLPITESCPTLASHIVELLITLLSVPAILLHKAGMYLGLMNGWLPAWLRVLNAIMYGVAIELILSWRKSRRLSRPPLEARSNG